MRRETSTHMISHRIKHYTHHTHTHTHTPTCKNPDAASLETMLLYCEEAPALRSAREAEAALVTAGRPATSTIPVKTTARPTAPTFFTCCVCVVVCVYVSGGKREEMSTCLKCVCVYVHTPFITVPWKPPTTPPLLGPRLFVCLSGARLLLPLLTCHSSDGSFVGSCVFCACVRVYVGG